MKKTIIAIILVLLTSAMAFATDGTETLSVQFYTSFTMNEIQPFSFSMTRKSGTGIPGNLYASDASWTNWYTTSPYNGQTPGCFKVVGSSGAGITTSIVMPATLTYNANQIALVTSGSSKMDGAKSTISCADAVTQTYNQTLLDGSTVTTLPSNGTYYFAYKFNTLSQVQIKSYTQGKYSGTAVVTVNYN